MVQRVQRRCSHENASWAPRRFALAVSLGVFATYSAAGFLTFAEEPKTSDPPPEIQRLLDLGEVTFEFYDPRQVRRRFPGEARFDLRFEQMFRFDYAPIESEGRVVGAKVKVEAQNITPRTTHKIVLPDFTRGNGLWDHVLLRHELDHVAISTDPRIELLLAHLYKGVQTIEPRLQPGERLTAEWVEAQVNRALSARTNALIRLMNSNYTYLDKVSQHGTQPIPERDEFFARLYTKANLDEAEFEFTGDVLELLKSDEYAAARAKYLSESP